MWEEKVDDDNKS